MTAYDTAIRPGGSPGPATPSIVPRGPVRLALIALTVAVLAQLLRYAVPVLGHQAVASGSAGAVLSAAGACLVGLLAPVLRAAGGQRVLVAAGIGGLLAVRVVAQALSPAPWIALAALALGSLAVAALYEAARGLSGVGFTIAAVGGLAVDTAVTVGGGTWDPIWQSGAGAWLVCAAFTGACAVALVRELASPAVPPPAGISRRDAVGAVAFGPYLALQVLILSSPGFLAAAGWHSLYGAHVALIAGQGLALALLASGVAVRAVPGGVCTLGGTLLGVAAAVVTGAFAISGTAVVGIVIVAQVLAAWLLAVALRAPLRRVGRGGPVWWVDLGAVAGTLLVPLILVPYAISSVHPLPVAANLLPAAAGLILGLLAALAAVRGGPLPARAPLRALAGGAVAAVLLLGTLGFYLTDTHGVARAGDAGSFRVTTYDLATGVSGDGGVDLEGVAAAIEAQKPDVVLLQGAGRGSLLAGGADTGVWLSRRLRMHLIWGPSGDGQYGNAILTSRRVLSSGSAGLPYADDHAPRGYVWARLEIGETPVTVWSTQFQPGATQKRARTAETGRLVRDWSGAPRTLIGGDLAADPGAADTEGLVTAGFQPAAPSGETTRGGGRTDRILGTTDLLLSATTVTPRGPSAHYPVTVTVTVPR